MNATATSISSYHALMRSGQLSKKCEQLVTMYHHHGILADFEAAPILGWHQSQVSARRGDLMVKDHEGHCTGKGLITEYGTVMNPLTNREVTRYKLNLGEQPTLI